MRNAPLACLALLAVLFATTLFIVERTEPRVVVSGQVIADGQPVARASVRCKGTASFTTTDRHGRFKLSCQADRITAWKDGHYIAGAHSGAGSLTLSLQPLPAEDNDDYAWVDPRPDPKQAGNCGNCHAEIFREWATSAHARSANGRHFRNLLDGSDWHGRPNAGWNLLNEHPDGAGVCAACHAPTITSFNDPAYTDLRKATGIAAQGIHCDYCHKIAGVADGQFGLTHGRFNLNLLRPKEGQLFFGSLDDVDRGEDAYAPIYRDSRYCASCHEGTVFGVHVYSTYSEWLESPARKQGKQCQTCHMKPTGAMTNIAPGRGGIERDPSTLGNHRFFTGSQEEMLRHALNLEASVSRNTDGTRLTVAVWSDDVGHRIPTGFVDRHLILCLEAFDSGRNTLSIPTGPTLPQAAGDLAGKSGKLYAKLLTTATGSDPVPFWRDEVRTTDTRLLPSRVDRTEYLLPPSASRVRVRLLYRRFWESVRLAKAWPDGTCLVAEREIVVK